MVYSSDFAQSSLTGCELLAECARNLGNAVVWDEFYSRYKRKILTYLWRAFAMTGGRSEEFVHHADDWLQDVFTKLIQNDGQAVRSFRGSNDMSVSAFLASIALSAVGDHLRSRRAVRRNAQFVPLDDFNEFSASNARWSSSVTALLDVIDVERALKAGDQSRTPHRDLLIFKLHYIEGLTAKEIASIPGFNLTTSGLEKVLNRLRNRIGTKERQSSNRSVGRQQNEANAFLSVCNSDLLSERVGASIRKDRYFVDDFDCRTSVRRKD